MSEFASYALDETFDEENRRAWEMPDGEPINPLFDWECHDANSLTHYTQELTGMLEGNAGPFERFSSLPSYPTPALNLSALKPIAAKYQRAWEMRLGMARQVLNNKPLSSKQSSWMETNWKGGTKKFLSEVSPQLVKLLEKRLDFILEIQKR